MEMMILSTIRTIFEDGLFDVNSKTPIGHLRGFEVLGDTFPRALMNVARIFRKAHGHPPDLLNPTLFSEMILLHRFFGLFPDFSPTDKILSKRFIEGFKGGKIQFLQRPMILDHPILPHAEDLAAGSYWLKSNYGSGANLKIDWPILESERKSIEALLQSWQNRKHAPKQHLWWNELTERKIIIEQDISSQNEKTADDWKFHVINGRVFIFQHDEARTAKHRQTLYTRNGKRSPYALYGEPADIGSRPKNLATMIDAAEFVGQNFDYIRVDFFEFEGDVYFTELGPIPTGGRQAIRSKELDIQMGRAFSPAWLRQP